jgi:hypothetical protein
MMRNYRSLNRHATLSTLCMLGALTGAACGGDGSDKLDDRVIPVLPVLNPGQAVLSGKVVDSAGQGVANATIAIAETGLKGMTGPDGAYSLMVPSDSTLSLQVSATGYGRTLVESVMVASMQTSTGFDVLLLTREKIDSINVMARPGSMGGYGAVALTIRSASGNCTAEGAKISMSPSSLGTVYYAKKVAGQPVTDPDPALTAVERTDGVAAWLGGVTPSGFAYFVNVSKTGCPQAAYPVAFGGRTHEGLKKVEADGLTQLTLFLQ